MKSLQSHLEQSYMNEGLGVAALTLFGGLAFILGIDEVAARAVHGEGAISIFKEAFQDMFQDWKSYISEIKKDKKLREIADKYKDDPDVIEYLKNPRMRGWRKMLETKLSPDEVRYINSLCRRYFE